MTAAVFLGFWVALGLAIVFVAIRGGPRKARETLYVESRRGRRLGGALLALVYIGFGVAVPTLVLAANEGHKAEVGPGGVTLNAQQVHGRALFAAKCATCHTLAGAHAVGRVGPNLDLLRPPSALVLDAVLNGRARGSGQMPALLYDGQDARDVAAFVAAVAGH